MPCSLVSDTVVLVGYLKRYNSKVVQYCHDHAPVRRLQIGRAESRVRSGRQEWAVAAGGVARPRLKAVVQAT
jgi:hypothetical protein